MKKTKVWEWSEMSRRLVSSGHSLKPNYMMFKQGKEKRENKGVCVCVCVCKVFWRCWCVFQELLGEHGEPPEPLSSLDPLDTIFVKHVRPGSSAHLAGLRTGECWVLLPFPFLPPTTYIFEFIYWSVFLVTWGGMREKIGRNRISFNEELYKYEKLIKSHG